MNYIRAIHLKSFMYVKPKNIALRKGKEILIHGFDVNGNDLFMI